MALAGGSCLPCALGQQYLVVQIAQTSHFTNSVIVASSRHLIASTSTQARLLAIATLDRT
jgi:hypothetical protein